MTTAQELLILLPVAYLMGSVPFGLIVGLAKGIDPRKAGSGNIGATNVGRLLGGKFFGIVFTLDRLKGLLPTLLASWIVHRHAGPKDSSIYLLWLAVGFAAIVGPDIVSAKKPDGAHIREAVLKVGGDPARAIMVGDSTTDTRAAAHDNIPCILVSFGYSDVPLVEMGGDITIDHYDEFEAALTKLM